GMKVTSSDIRRLVAEALREKAKTFPPTPQRAENLIDSLIREEIVQFTSLDQLEDPFNIGAKPLSPDQISGANPPPPLHETIDTRQWPPEDSTLPGSESAWNANS